MDPEFWARINVPAFLLLNLWILSYDISLLEFRKRKLRRSASLMYGFRCVNQKPHKEGQSHTGQNIEQGMLFDEHGRQDDQDA